MRTNLEHLLLVTTVSSSQEANFTTCIDVYYDGRATLQLSGKEEKFDSVYDDSCTAENSSESTFSIKLRFLSRIDTSSDVMSGMNINEQKNARNK